MCWHSTSLWNIYSPVEAAKRLAWRRKQSTSPVTGSRGCQGLEGPWPNVALLHSLHKHNLHTKHFTATHWWDTQSEALSHDSGHNSLPTSRGNSGVHHYGALLHSYSRGWEDTRGDKHRRRNESISPTAMATKTPMMRKHRLNSTSKHYIGFISISADIQIYNNI